MSFGHRKHYPAKDFSIPTAGLSRLTPSMLFNGLSSLLDRNPRGGDGASIWSPAKPISSVIGVSNTTMQGSSRFPSSLMPSTNSRPSLSYQNPCGGDGGGGGGDGASIYISPLSLQRRHGSQHGL